MKLEEIDWPVFKLGLNKPITIDNVSFYVSEYYKKDTGEIHKSIRIIDDKNLTGATLGLRRLQLYTQEAKLYPVKISLYFIGDLIKLAKPTTWFIDNNGKIFQYQKTRRVKLTSYKIKNILASKGMGCILELENHVQRYKCLFKPTTERYAGLLHINNGFVLYGLYDQAFKPTYRLV